MILASPKWEHKILFDDGSITHLTIENPITFRKYVLELQSQLKGDDGSFVLSQDNAEVSISKNLAMLSDSICFEFDTRKINAKIVKDIIGMACSGEYCKDVYPLISSITCMAENLVEAYPLNISYDDPTIESLGKMLSFHLEPEYDNSCDKLLEWMTINHDVLNIGNFIILNPELYFSEEELAVISSEASSSKHNVLFIDATCKYRYDRNIIIDEDNCEIL